MIAIVYKSRPYSYHVMEKMLYIKYSNVSIYSFSDNYVGMNNYVGADAIMFHIPRNYPYLYIK